AIAVDPSGSFAFVGVSQVNALYAVPLAAGGAILVGPLPGSPSSLQWLSSGELLAGLSSGISRIHPTTAAAALGSRSGGSLNDIGVETVSGNHVVGPSPGGSPANTFMIVTPAGGVTVHTGPPAGGWGAGSGVAVVPAMRAIGPPSAGNNAYAFALDPNP